MRHRSPFLGKLLRPVRNEDGATLIFFALIVMVLLGTFALAVDVGAALNARSEAQRTADAAALAGAGLFKTLATSKTPDVIAPLARDTAEEFALKNTVGWQAVEELDVDIQVWPAEQKVGVEIRGESPLFFAPFLGVVNLPVRAYAEARVIGAAGADCVKPFAIPDMWQAGGAAPVYNYPENSLWDGFDPNQGDHYERWDGTLTHMTATGYGAPKRNGVSNWQGNSYMHDNGRKIVIKSNSHGLGHNEFDAEVPVDAAPSAHYIMDPGDEYGYSSIPGVSCNGNNVVKKSICSCNNRVINIGDSLDSQTGVAGGNVTPPIEDLIDADPGLSWSPANGGQVVDSHGSVVTESPRIVKVVLYDPTTLAGGPPGNFSFEVANIALVFLEGTQGNGQNKNILGRFLMYADGTGAGTGSTIRMLQLVK